MVVEVLIIRPATGTSLPIRIVHFPPPGGSKFNPASQANFGTTFGHNAPADDTSYGCAAANVAQGIFDSDTLVESFSSDGPSLVYFDSMNTLIASSLAFSDGVRIQQPKAVGGDGVDVTGNGGFPMVFFGTFQIVLFFFNFIRGF